MAIKIKGTTVIDDDGRILNTNNLTLKEIAETKSVSATDVFVYDTTKDSDGGAWRHRCAGTSWFNEPLNTANRGSRREFPAVAVIVAENTRMTIYDGDDPDLPMWMIFRINGSNDNQNLLNRDGNGLNAVVALNGIIAVAAKNENNFSGGVRLIRFVADDGFVYGEPANNVMSGFYKGNIADRNSQSGFDGNGNTAIADRNVFDVAMSVLPGAPTDPATGLPVPTIVAGTSGGVSVIKDDKNIFNITSNSSWGSSARHVELVNGNIYFIQLIHYWLKIPISAITQNIVYGFGFNTNAPFVRMQPNGIGFSATDGIAAKNASFELAYTNNNTDEGMFLNGVLLLGQDATMRANITSKFNT